MKYVFAVIVVGAVLGAGAWYMNKGEKPDGAQEAVVSVEPKKFSGSLFDLAAAGGSYRCTVSQTVQGITMSGVVQVSDENVRADFSGSMPVVGDVSMYMIATGDEVYSWSSLMPKGIRTKRVETTQDTGAAALSGQGVDLGQSYEYDCVPAKADASIFIPPADVVFDEAPSA